MEGKIRGGARPGAGRKPGQVAARKNVARQVTLRPELWAEIDEMQERLGLTRSAVFEEMAKEWLAKMKSAIAMIAKSPPA